jgi:Mrp family chromosome partitioning ATPase
VLLDITQLPLPLEEAVRGVRAALPDSMLVALDTTAQPETIWPPCAPARTSFCTRRWATISGRRSSAGPRSVPGRGRMLRPPGKVLGFLSVKGGCGASTIACHLAAELGRLSAQRGERCLLADLDLQSGIVGFLMKVKSPYSVLDAVQNLHRLDVSYWNALVSAEWPGLEIVAAPAGYLPKDPVPENL